MTSIRSPPSHRKTPRDFPELVSKFREKFRELTKEKGLRKWKALETIAEQYGLKAASSVEYWLFPQRKIYQKNFGSIRWSYEKNNPITRNKIINYKKEYMFARRHIDEYIRTAFSKTPLAEALTLETLAYCIHAQTGILFSPKTILGLVKHHQAYGGKPLLVEVPGYNFMYYRLAKPWAGRI